MLLCEKKFGTFGVEMRRACGQKLVKFCIGNNRKKYNLAYTCLHDDFSPTNTVDLQVHLFPYRTHTHHVFLMCLFGA